MTSLPSGKRTFEPDKFDGDSTLLKGQAGGGPKMLIGRSETAGGRCGGGDKQGEMGAQIKVESAEMSVRK